MSQEINTDKYDVVSPAVLRRALLSVCQPGNTLAITGKRGGGKTHLAVWLIEWLVKHGWVVLTNILFMRRTGPGEYDFEEAYPRGIYKIQSMAEMYYYAATILKKDRKQKIAVVRDEAQNYIIAFKANSQMEVELFRSEGDYRKFNILSVYLTPTFDYLPKGIREQYVKGHFWKTEEYQKKGVFAFSAYGSKPAIVKVGLSRWARPYDQVKVGDYVYDTLASASMDLGIVGGKEFNIFEFRHYYSGRIFTEIPDAILEYFRMRGGIDTLRRDNEEDERARAKAWAFEAWNRGMSTSQVAKYIDEVSDRTVRRWRKEWESRYTDVQA